MSGDTLYARLAALVPSAQVQSLHDTYSGPYNAGRQAVLDALADWEAEQPHPGTKAVPVTVQADEEELTITVERLYLAPAGSDPFKVRIASSDNRTTHWFTVEQARTLANVLVNQAADAALANLDPS